MKPTVPGPKPTTVLTVGEVNPLLVQFLKNTWPMDVQFRLQKTEHNLDCTWRGGPRFDEFIDKAEAAGVRDQITTIHWSRGNNFEQAWGMALNGLSI